MDTFLPSRLRVRQISIIILLGIGLRLWFIAVSPLNPAFSNADDGDYYQRALRFALTGQYLDDAWLIRPPLHVFFFAACMRLALLFGQPLQALLYVQLAQTLVSALTIALGYGVARRLFQRERAGLLFASFLAFWYPFVEQPDVLFSEMLYLFLFMLHVWLLLISSQTSVVSSQTENRPEKGKNARMYLFASGMALGLAALTRSPALYSLAFVLIWLLLRPGSSVQSRYMAAVRHFVVILVGCMLIVLPWTARNYLLYGHVIPVDTLGQINLWLDLDRVADRTPNIELLRSMPQSERASYAMARARELLAERPLRIFDNTWPNFQHIWKAQFIEDYFLKSSFFTRPLRETALLGLFGDLLWLIFSLAGLIGLVGRPREGWHWRLFFLAWIAYSIFTVIVFHVEPRYLTPLWTLLGLYGAGTLASLPESSKSRAGKLQTPQSRQDAKDKNGTKKRPHAGRSVFASLRFGSNAYLMLQTIVTIIFLALVLSYRDYPAIIGRGLARERAMSAAERAFQQASYPEAERLYSEALSIQPSFVDAKVGLALALTAQDKLEQAQAAIQSGGSRQADLLGHVLEAVQANDETTATTALQDADDTMAIAGEDSQAWLMRWLRRPDSSHIRLGSPEDLGRIQGFHALELGSTGSYRWLRGQGTAQLQLEKPIAAEDRLVLRLNAGQAQAVQLSLRLDDGPTQHILVTGGSWRRYILSLPPSALGSTKLQISLSAPTFVPALRNPDSSDLRRLSLMVSEIKVE